MLHSGPLFLLFFAYPDQVWVSVYGFMKIEVFNGFWHSGPFHLQKNGLPVDPFVAPGDGGEGQEGDLALRRTTFATATCLFFCNLFYMSAIR